jgi:hypothetical protein
MVEERREREGRGGGNVQSKKNLRIIPGLEPRSYSQCVRDKIPKYVGDLERSSPLDIPIPKGPSRVLERPRIVQARLCPRLREYFSLPVTLPTIT